MAAPVDDQRRRAGHLESLSPMSTRLIGLRASSLKTPGRPLAQVGPESCLPGAAEPGGMPGRLGDDVEEVTVELPDWSEYGAVEP